MLKKIAGSVFSLVVFIVLVVSAVSSAGPNETFSPPSSFDLKRVAAAESARWVAMGNYYNRLADTQRQRSIQADAARWIAKGEYYDSLFDPARVVAAESTRWIAMGEYYTRLAEIQRQRSIQADVDRWIAKGTFYTRLATADLH